MQDIMSGSSKNTPAARRVPTGRPAPSQPPRQSYRAPKEVGPARRAPGRSDPFPIVLGAIIGAMVIGLMVVVYLISSNGIPGGGPQPTTIALNTATVGGVDATPQGTAVPTEEPAPRIALADFKKLYDNPATRPLIIDVRAKEAYDAGHIEGAISFPEADVDTRVGELPKDKLVVAYCQ
jgi:hypothetical protein